MVSHILRFVSSGKWTATPTKTEPLWVPAITAAFGPFEQLPQTAMLTAVERGVEFYRSSRLLPTVERAIQLNKLECGKSMSDECAKFARQAPPYYAPGKAHCSVC